MKAAEKSPAVEGLIKRETRLETLEVLPEHGTDIENRIGEWSEKDMAQISSTETETP